MPGAQKAPARLVSFASFITGQSLSRPSSGPNRIPDLGWRSTVPRLWGTLGSIAGYELSATYLQNSRLRRVCRIGLLPKKTSQRRKEIWRDEKASRLNLSASSAGRQRKPNADKNSERGSKCWPKAAHCQAPGSSSSWLGRWFMTSRQKRQANYLCLCTGESSPKGKNEGKTSTQLATLGSTDKLQHPRRSNFKLVFGFQPNIPKRDLDTSNNGILADVFGQENKSVCVCVRFVAAFRIKWPTRLCYIVPPNVTSQSQGNQLKCK